MTIVELPRYLNLHQEGRAVRGLLVLTEDHCVNRSGRNECETKEEVRNVVV